MYSFIICLAILIAGYFIYSKFVEKVFGPDERTTPAVELEDGVDYIVMPEWKMCMIQLLNIAGLGPIWGAVGGALWGPAVFLWITFGTVFAGIVHDFASGFLSIRNNGKSISEVCGIYMGNKMKRIMRIFSVVLLFMVGVVFAKGPAGLLSFLCSSGGSTGILANASFWLVVIIVYYFIATFLSIDKIIGKIYPVFGFCLITMALGVGVGIFVRGYASNIPELWDVIGENMHPDGTGAWPMMFISVACGAISGFHSTQSPIMARCCKSEKQCRKVFSGAMVCEGVIALIWAAASCALFSIEGGVMSGLKDAMSLGQATCVYNICESMMGKAGVLLAMIGVIVCPITSGDTAFRSARLTIADWTKSNQKSVKRRLLLTAPLLALAYIVCQFDYTSIWNYFASCNQIFATIVLWVAAMYLIKNKRNSWIAVVPAVFMSAVTMTCVLSSDLYLGKISFFARTANIGGIVIAASFFAIFLIKYKKYSK